MGTKIVCFIALFLVVFYPSGGFASTAVCSKKIASGRAKAGKLGVLVIGDAFSSGKRIAPRARKRGLITIMVQSSPKMTEPIPGGDPLRPQTLLDHVHWEDFTWNGDVRNFVFNGDIKDLARQIDAFRLEVASDDPDDLPPIEFIPGSETAVPLIDSLSEYYGTRTNGTMLSPSRRDKYPMGETLRATGIPAVRQFVSDDLDYVLDNAPSLGPVVVIKPRNSAATDKVFFCRTRRQIGEAFHAIMNQTNVLGHVNRDILVQEYLDGDEYVVDIAGRDGEITELSISKYRKLPNGVYEREDIIAYDEARRLGLVAYARLVVDGLGIKNGAAHLEIKLTSRGPVLVEAGARLSGGDFPVFAEAATGVNPVDVLLDAYYDPEAFQRRLQKHYQAKPARILYFISPKRGKLIAMPYLEKIERLPGFQRSKMNVSPGDFLEKTTNFLNYPGHVEFVHDDPLVLDEVERQIRQWEAQPDFYCVE